MQQRIVRRVAVLVSSFCAAALASLACAEQEYPGTAFRCDPSLADACPGSHVCCSTDPASLDLAALGTSPLPEYAGGPGRPLFSGINNSSSRVGRCVELGSVGMVATFTEVDGAAAAGCPRPCNPNWEAADVTAACGAGSFCCPTEELGDEDCVYDRGIGDDGCLRPVEGRDIESLGGLDITTWAASAHDTHQDPRGLGCQAFVSALEPAATTASVEDLLRACYRQLGVANQRGLCTPGGGASEYALVCPLADPNHRDACERMNDENQLTGCEAFEFP